MYNFNETQTTRTNQTFQIFLEFNHTAITQQRTHKYKPRYDIVKHYERGGRLKRQVKTPQNNA